MAILGSQILTLSDWAKRKDPDGKTAKIVEMLSQSNEILDDELFMEGNLVNGMQITTRTGLPTVAWRLLNQGVQPSKSTTAQAIETTGAMEAWSEVDEEVAKLNGNVASFRLSEAQAFIEAMNQEHASTLFYGNSATAPEEFTGLSIRYSDLGADSGQNIIDAGGTGSDNASIWLVCWGQNTIHGLFPKGSKAGLDHVDLGLQVVETTAGIGGTRMMAYREKFGWKTGLAVKDWRFASRTANIDVSDLIAKSSAADLTDNLIKMIHRMPNLNMGKCAFYMNRTVKQMFDIQRRDDVAGAGMKYDEVDGKVVMSFRGIPVRTCDALLETEARVV